MSRAEVEAFFESYCHAFNELDGDTVAGLWHSPSGIAHSNRAGDAGEVTWWSAGESMRENMQKLCELYRANDYSHAEFRIESLASMGAHHAFVDMHWDLYRSSGDVLQSFNTGYNLMRTVNGIRVLMATQYQEDMSKMKQDSKGSSNAAQ